MKTILSLCLATLIAVASWYLLTKSWLPYASDAKSFFAEHQQFLNTLADEIQSDSYVHVKLSGYNQDTIKARRSFDESLIETVETDTNRYLPLLSKIPGISSIFIESGTTFIPLNRQDSDGYEFRWQFARNDNGHHAAVCPSQVNANCGKCVLPLNDKWSVEYRWLLRVMPTSIASCPFIANPDDPLQQGYTAYGEGDYDKAFERFSQLVKQGNPEAQYSLAYMYKNGEGTPDNAINDSEAAKLYQQAAAQGHLGSMFALTILYGIGLGVEADVEKVKYWYLKAAELGSPFAQITTAQYYADGKTPDYQKAYIWSAIAQKNGDKEAQQKKDEYAKKLTAEQLKEAERAIAKLSVHAVKP